ncbi:MAG: carboxypeptidase-like regulatory domain-containing protein [Pedobacter sp.]|nr:MAG: carboxypeptidase-like regulatory domain-containing protein [Pedobacter sp.]
MRYIFLFFFSLMIFASILSNAQQITIKQKNMTLPNVLKEIRKQSKLDFLYNEELLKGAKPINLNLKNASIAQALDSTLVNLPVTYTIHDMVVMIIAKEEFVQVRNVYSITGQIKDDKGLPLPGASVFLSGYKVGTVADADGKFVIPNLTPGNYDVLVQMLGYLPLSQNVLIANKSKELTINLQENIKLLTEVVIKPSPYRSQYLRIFREHFIGTSINASDCEIINPQVIRFDYDSQRRVLTANADEFLIIENKALGYRIRYLLNFFEKDDETGMVHFYGYPYFEEMEVSKRKRKQLEKKREVAYKGSPQHFFKSLFNNTDKQEGFTIHKMIKAPNHKKQPDKIIDERIKSFSEKLRKRSDEKRRKISLNYWKKMKLEPDTVEVMIREEVQRYFLVYQKSPALKTLEFKDALYIVYKGEKEPVDYVKYSGYKIKRPDDFVDYQISIVYGLKRSPAFYENGGIYDPQSLLFEGVWAYELVADMVPMDYVLPSRK